VFHTRVHEYARLLAGLSSQATKVTKRQLYDDLLHDDPAASVNGSKELIGELMGRPDYTEGVRALIEKREPRFGP
jgi:enoyl-CoA hydratase/carnithine racemase